MNSTAQLLISAGRPAVLLLGALALMTACFQDSQGAGATTTTSTATSEGTGTGTDTGAGEPTSGGTGTSTEAVTSGTTSEPTTGGGSSSTSGASTGEPGCEAGVFIGRDEALVLVRDDLLALAPEVRVFARYISLVHLNNAGLCREDIDRVRRGVGKLVNALSQRASITQPKSIDAAGLLLRIDLRDYAWHEPIVVDDSAYANAWERIAAASPYAIRFTGDLATDIAASADTEYAVLPAEPLMAVAALPPVYYDVLRVPLTRDALAQTLDLDLAAIVAEERATDPDAVGRAAFHDSGLSHLHRAVERYEVPFAAERALWRTYDFTGNSGSSNIFLHPFDFEFGGAELIFTLPNGLHGYMITDAAGQRLDEQVVNLILDPGSKDHVVRAGLSCIGCHVDGIHAVADDLRWEIDQGLAEGAFTQDVLDEIRALYPTREDFAQLVALDRQRFALACETAGAPVGGEEPVRASVTEFERPVDLARAAAELWLTEEELATSLGVLPIDLAPLARDSIPRDVFTEHYAKAVCQLDIGATPTCP